MGKSFFLTVFLVLGLSAACLAQYTERDSDIYVPITGDLAEGSSTQTYRPGIMFSSLLDNVRVNAKGGSFRLGNKIQNVFVPEGSTGKLVVSRAGGSVLFYWKWKLDTFRMPPPYKLFAFKQPLNRDGSNMSYDKLKLTEPGDYSLDFFMGGKHFFTFPLSVKTVEPENPFDGNTLYFTDGAWNDWGYLYIQNADPSKNLIWKIWMREASHARPDHKVMVTIVRDKDGKLICQSRPRTTKRFLNEWVWHNFDMVNPPVKTSGGAYFKAKDLLAVDGGYTLTMKIDGEVYGVWKFKIINGKPNYTGKTVRGEADSKTFVEGGKDAFWYKRESK